MEESEEDSPPEQMGIEEPSLAKSAREYDEKKSKVWVERCYYPFQPIVDYQHIMKWQWSGLGLECLVN